MKNKIFYATHLVGRCSLWAQWWVLEPHHSKYPEDKSDMTLDLPGPGTDHWDTESGYLTPGGSSSQDHTHTGLAIVQSHPRGSSSLSGYNSFIKTIVDIDCSLISKKTKRMIHEANLNSRLCCMNKNAINKKLMMLWYFHHVTLHEHLHLFIPSPLCMFGLRKRLIYICSHEPKVKKNNKWDIPSSQSPSGADNPLELQYMPAVQAMHQVTFWAPVLGW